MTPPRRLRLLLAAAALLLLVWGTVLEHRRRSQAEAVRARFRASDLESRHPGVRDEIHRETDPALLRLQVARAVLADALHAQWLTELPPERIPEEVRAMQERLELAEAMARSVIPRRPALWEGPFILGGSRFLAAWRRGGDAVYRDPAEWREPLQAARRLAPAAHEPVRLLATATLVAWPGLGEEQRTAARDLLREAFRDPVTLGLLADDWRAAAPSEAAFEELLPDRARTWTLLLEEHARQSRWDAYCRLRSRWWRSLLAEAGQRLEEGSRQRTQGDPERARVTLLGVLAGLPVDRRTSPLVERIFRELPPGPVAEGVSSAIEEWLRWALPLRLRGLVRLPEAVFGRMASLGADLPPDLLAQAWIAADELELAEAVERRSDRLYSEDWGPYFLAKAAWFLDHDREEEAARALDEVHSAWHATWVHQRLARELGRRRGPPDVAELREGTAWRWRGAQAWLELPLASSREGVQITIDQAPPEGAPLLVRIDGREEACLAVTTGTQAEIRRPLSPGIHFLETFSPGPVRVAPGDVRTRVGA